MQRKNMKKKKGNYRHAKGRIRYFHLMKRFRERVGEELNYADIYDMLEQIKNNPDCFLKWTKKYNVGIYKVNYRGCVIIIISNKKTIFTTYGVYKDADKLSAIEESFTEEQGDEE